MYQDYKTKMGEHTDTELIFFINGQKITEKKPDPASTLLQYLRKQLLLPGTKEGCGFGGCGACTVMISKYDVIKKTVSHYTVNACLFPLCATHGLAITTVEGVGNPRTGLHAIQESLVRSHGLQCGFCTPGFVMSAFTLLRNNPNPSREDVERALEGNLCRCTGYRPIVDAIAAVTEGQCPMGADCCKNKQGTQEQDPKVTLQQTEGTALDETQVPIFPPELKLRPEFQIGRAEFTGENYIWIRPETLQQLISLRSKYPDAPVIMGNTTAVFKLRTGKYESLKVLLHARNIPELNYIKVTTSGIEVGAAISVSQLLQELPSLADQIREPEKKRHIKAMHEMLYRFAIDQIRNCATVGGSLLCGRNDSDLLTFFTCLDVTGHVISAKGTRLSHIDDLIVEQDEVLQAVTIPFTKQGQFVQYYKQAERRTFALAVVNSGMTVKLTPQNTVTKLRLTFGGFGPGVTIAGRAAELAVGRKFDDSLLHDVMSALTEDLVVDSSVPTEKYKLAVSSGFFFKFFNNCILDKNADGVPADNDLLRPLPMLSSESTRFYDPCTDPEQSDVDAVGRPLENVSSKDIASGEAVYTDDIPPITGELSLALVLSRKAHARVVRVDTSEALKVPGVKLFLNHTDVPGSNMFGIGGPDEEYFASEKVVCVGQIVGAIVATSRDIALKAADMVKVEYDVMKPITTIEEAIEANSFLGPPQQLTDGDVGKVLSESDHVIDGEYYLGAQEHYYMEPCAALVVPKLENNEFQVYATSQNIQDTQTGIASLLNLPANRIVVTLRRLGGSFGGKAFGGCRLTAAVALAAYKLRCPVRGVFPRTVDMETTGKRHPFLGKYKIGFDLTGKIKAFDLKLFNNGGCSRNLSLAVMEYAVTGFESAYKFDASSVEGLCAKTNIPSNTAYRGFGHSETAYMIEEAIFNAACRLNMSSDEVREKNLIRDGDVTAYGVTVNKVTVGKLWSQCKEQCDYNNRKFDLKEFNRQNRWKKRGMAMTAVKFGLGYPGRMSFFGQGAALVHIYLDGSVMVTHGGVEMGQGLNTKCLQIASRELGVPIDKMYTGDLSNTTIPNNVVTAGSMGTDLFGGAVKDACETLLARLKPLKEACPDDPWEAIIRKAFLSRIQLSATGFFTPEIVKFNNRDGNHPFYYYAYGAACTEVEIDVITGESQCLRTDIVFDIGKSLNPAIDIGQIEGAFIQGLGMVTSENIGFDVEGQPINCNPLKYKIPTVRSIPRVMNVTLMKNHDIVTNVYSSKGIGEPALLLSSSVLSAIKEAVMAARAEIGLTGYFRLDSPATIQAIQAACGNQLPCK